MNLVNDNPTRVTWTVDGVQHNQVSCLSNAAPKVTCGDKCCCKTPTTEEQP